MDYSQPHKVPVGWCLAVFLALVLVTTLVRPCFAQAAATQPAAPAGLTLAEGGKAFVRVKEYQAKPIERASPQGNATSFKFGDQVKFQAKPDGRPTFWLVSDGKGGPPASLPAYLLTPNESEITLLKTKDRIPESMTFVYEKIINGNQNAICLYGRCRMGPFEADSEGLAASNQGSKQVAFKGNGIVFDESAIKHTWRSPMVFSNGSTTFEMAVGKIFYCTYFNGDGIGTFDCVDLNLGMAQKQSK